MGIIFSKPRDYVARKVDDCKKAIRKKVDDTKSAIVNRIHSSVQSVKQCLVTTKDDIVGSIVGVKDNICGRITRKVNCVCDACRSVRDNIVGKVNYVKNSVISAKNSVVDTVVSTKNGIFNRYNNKKNYIKDTYIHRKNSIKKKYYDIRNAKLTKCQKLKYSLIGLIIMWMMYIVIATSFDLYVGDFISIEERFSSIRDNACTIGYNTYALTCTIIVNTYLGLHYTIIVLWKYSKIIIIQAYHNMTEVKKYLFESSKEAIHYVFDLISITLETVVFYFLEMCSYIWMAMCYIADKTSQIILLILEHLIYYCKIGWQNFKIGSKVAYHHSKVGLSYAYKHGTVFLKDVIQRGSHFLYYLITDFKHASVDGLIWSWGATKQLVHSTIEASHLTYNYFCLTLAYLHQSLISLSSWSYETSFKLSDAFSNACSYTYSTGLDLSSKAYEGLIYASDNTYEAMIQTYMYLYDKACVFVFFLIKCFLSIYNSFINASFFIYEQFSYFMNEYGFEWLYKLKELIFNTTSILFRALSKFFSDLGHLLYKFVTVTSERIYNITYFFFYIIFKILHISLTTFKYVLSSLVVLMKILFTSIVWFMKFVIIGYSSFLSSYNNYRESIFFSIMTFISIYCVSVAKDRKISEQKYLLEMEMSDDDDEKDDKVYKKAGDDDKENDNDYKKADNDDDEENDNDYKKADDDDEENVDRGELNATHDDVDFDSSFSHDDADDDVESNDKGVVDNDDKHGDNVDKEPVLETPSPSINSSIVNNTNDNNNNPTQNISQTPFRIYYPSSDSSVATNTDA